MMNLMMMMIYCMSALRRPKKKVRASARSWIHKLYSLFPNGSHGATCEIHYFIYVCVLLIYDVFGFFVYTCIRTCKKTQRRRRTIYFNLNGFLFSFIIIVFSFPFLLCFYSSTRQFLLYTKSKSVSSLPLSSILIIVFVKQKVRKLATFFFSFTNPIIRIIRILHSSTF